MAGRALRGARLKEPGSEALLAKGNATLGQVIGRQLNLYLVTGEDADVVLAHLAGDMGRDNVTIVELDAEHGVGQGVDHRAIHLYLFFFGHET